MFPPTLLKELQDNMSLTRLAKTGLFQKMDVDDQSSEGLKEFKLHRAVLDRALIDSFSSVERVRADVAKWLKQDNQDFIDCCDRAGLDSDLVYECFHLMKDILKGRKARFTKFGEKKQSTDE